MSPTKTDSSFEDDLRAMLNRRAADIGPSETRAEPKLTLPPRPQPSRSKRRLLVRLAAAALIAAVLATAFVLRGDDAERVGTDVAEEPDDGGSRLPVGFSLDLALPVFAGDGTADEIARSYLEDRLPDFPSPGITLEPAVVDGDLSSVRWTAGDDAGELSSGVIHMRMNSVVLATTDGVDLSDLSYDDDRVRGLITSSSDESLFADVLDEDGEPVPGAPRPAGMPGAGYRFGTAGGPGQGELRLDVPAFDTRVDLRVHLVGGTLLSISELALTRPPWVVWPHDGAPGIDRSTPESTVTAFCEQVLGDTPTSVVEQRARPPAARRFDVALSSGATIEVAVARAGSAEIWNVIDLGASRISIADGPARVIVTVESEAVTVDLRIQSGTGAETLTRPMNEAANGILLTFPLVQLRSVVVIYRDATGRIIDAGGTSF